MSERTREAVGAFAGAWCALALVACGGEAKPADSPGACPPGTVLSGSDCVASEAAKESSIKDDSASGSSARQGPSTTDKPDEHASSAGDTSGGSSSGPTAGAPPASGKLPYDKDAVEIELKRAARQVKANCGSATDEGGKAAGPWGKTTANITLGRNGHIKQVTVPAPYSGTPSGVCVVHAFEKIQFPPYAASSDVAVDWDVELVKKK